MNLPPVERPRERDLSQFREIYGMQGSGRTARESESDQRRTFGRASSALEARCAALIGPTQSALSASAALEDELTRALEVCAGGLRIPRGAIRTIIPPRH